MFSVTVVPLRHCALQYSMKYVVPGNGETKAERPYSPCSYFSFFCELLCSLKVLSINTRQNLQVSMHFYSVIDPRRVRVKEPVHTQKLFSDG